MEQIYPGKMEWSAERC